MAKIDSDRLIERIKRLDPYYYDSVAIKWEILKIIRQEAEDDKREAIKGPKRTAQVD